MHRIISLLATAGMVIYGLLPHSAALAQSTNSSEVTRGITWLSGQVTAGGTVQSEQTSIATAIQTRAETYLTLKSLTSPPTALADAVVSESDANSEYLARKIMVQVTAGRDASSLVTQLRSLQNVDGGFGTYAGFASSALDTAWALQALKAAGVLVTDSAVSVALSYLQSVQATDGSFSIFEQSSSYVTSVSTIALAGWASNANLNAPIQLAVSYLLAQRASDGSWSNSVYLTSLAFNAIRGFQPQEPLATSIKTFLIANQQSAGSWGNGDPYVSALALRALQLTATSVSNPTLAKIRGKVVDTQTSQALSGVTVSLAGASTASVVTGDSGTFEFGGIQPGTYSLRVNLSNYSSLLISVTAVAGATLDVGTLQLNKNPTGSTGTVRGVVSAAANGAPLAGVAVSVTGVTDAVVTDAAGSYQINNVPVGPVTIQASKAGYSTFVSRTTMVAGAVLVFSPQLTIGASSATTVKGTVTSAATGLPIAGVRMGVFVSDNPVGSGIVYTDAQGNYSITNLPAGAVMLQAYDLTSYYDYVYIPATIYAGNTTIFSPKLNRYGTSNPQTNSAKIVGVVIDAGTNLPLANASVAGRFTNYFEAQNIVTGPDGRFAMNGIYSPAGTIEVTLAGYQGMTTAVTIDPLAVVDLGQVRIRRTQATNLLPDLLIRGVGRGSSATDAQKLTLTGAIEATVANAGNVAVTNNFQLLAFFDANHNGRYDSDVDVVLGQVAVTAGLGIGAQTTVTIPVSGKLPFRDAPIHVWADSGQAIVEVSESNNVRSTAQSNDVPPTAGAFAPVLKWQSIYGAISHTPLVGPLLDTNGDGKIDQKDTPAIVGIMAAGYMTALSGLDGHKLWQSTVGLASYGVTPAMGDIDGDGKPEIFAYTTDGRVIAFNNDGTTKWISAVSVSPGVYLDNTALTIADLGNNPPGKSNVIAGNLVLNHDGSLKWMGDPVGVTQSIPLVVDLDLDGSPEVVMGQNVYRADGTLYWKIPDSQYRFRNFPAVAHLDGDPYPQIVSTQYLQLVVYNHDGSVKWGPVGLPDAYNAGPPTIADLDGDGVPEVMVAGAGLFRVFNNDGSIKWTTRADDGSGVTGSTAFDFNNGGQVQVVYMNEVALRAFSGTDGTTIFNTPNPSATWIEYPAVADVDNDGHADIVVASSDGVRVFKDQNNAWAPTRSIWNQYNYHVTNINDDGSVPRNAAIGDNYRQQAKLNATSGGAIDLTASYVRVVDKAGLAPSTLTARIGNAGGYSASVGIKIAFFNGNPAAGGTLLGVVSTSVALNTGEYEDISLPVAGSLAGIGTLYVVADNNGAGVTSLVDFDRTNNTVSYPMTAQASSFAAQVATDKVAYGANAAVIINVNMTNTGSFAGSIGLRSSIQTVDGTNLATLSGASSVSLPAQGTSAVALSWNTATTLIGDYFAVTELLDADNRIVSSSRAMFTIVTDPPQPLVSVIYSDKAVYQFGESARLAGRVSNLSQNTLFDMLSLQTKVVGPSGSQVFNATRGLPQLTPGGIVDTTLSMSLATAAPGSYIVEQQLINGAGATVQTKTARFEVRSTADTGAGIKGTLAISPWRVNVGSTVGFAATVTNAGNAAVTALPVTIRIIDPTTGNLVQRLDTTLNIGLQQQQVWNTSWTSAPPLVAGTYVAALSIQPPSGEKVLAQDIMQIGAVKPFTFTSVVDVAVSSVQTSGAAQIDGIVIPESIRVTGGEYSINGGAFTSQAGQVQAGDLVVVRQIASATPGVKTTATIVVGVFSTGFDVTTLNADTTPDAFVFATQTNANVSTVVQSNIVTIAGINTTVPVSIVGGMYSVNGGAFTSASGMLKNGDTLTLKQTTSPSFSTKTTTTVTVGTVSAVFEVTTQAATTTPTPFSFTAQTGVAVNAVATSNAVTIAGINTSVPISIAGGQYSVNGSAYTGAAGSVIAGDVVAVRQTSSASFGTKTTATLTVGTFSAAFDVTTIAADTTPDAFSFTAQTNVAVGAVATSNTVTIVGINTAAPVSITGGTYSLNGGVYTAVSGTLKNGDTLTLRQTSSSANNTKTTATVTVGGVSATFDVTTTSAVNTPTPFSFTAQSNVALSTAIASNTVIITGITVGVPISIIGGQYSVNGGAFTSAAGTVSPNNTVAVRLTSSANYSTSTSAVLTVSNYSTSFVITTQAQQAPVIANEITREVRLLVLLSCKNSQGNADPACLEQKKTFLNTYLANQGLDFKLVTDAESFKSELRCGRYNTYWIAGGAEKLKDTLAEEIREAVFRGDSLIVDGTHDSRNAALDGVLGVQHQGNLSQATSVLVTSTVLPAGTFSFTGSANSVTVNNATATILANFNAANGNAAIVQGSYGQGKSIAYLFDLVGTLQAQSSSAMLASVLNQSLAAILPTVPANLTGDAYVPLDTKLVNGTNSAQTVDVVATVPNTLTVIAPVTPAPTSTVTSGNNTVYTWRVTLGANATQYIDWAVRAPTASGTYVIGYQANVVSGDTSTPLTSNNLSLVVQGADQGAAQTVSTLQALSPTNASERNARDRAVTNVQTATTKLNAGQYEDAVTNYLAATGELASISTASVTAAHTAIDRLMQESGRKWCRGATSCAVSSAGLPTGYNVTVFGSASISNGQADGSIGVGGAASLSSYTVASTLSGDLARLVVGGSLSYSNGSVGQNGSGVIKVAGSNSVSQNVGRASLVTTSVEDWSALKTQYLAFSDRLATQAGTAATIVSGNQFNCTGSNTSFNVCNITGSQLTNARTLNLNYPNSSSVLINVSGTAAATMSNGQANWNGQALSGSQYAGKVFFNFPQTTGLTISGFGIGGTILAPRAALSHSNSMIDGPVVVNTLSSTGSYKCSGTFQGTLPYLP